ncbi:contractile injection system tape measure protein [Dyadobacter sp. NIV53]|uniref:contractile injection system tape measure protein n=1 Tax=Dyadobacter sp. NIV53 TaxID=2861765 RepID=UPI001C8749A1|nr:contractile injection system tape measure protein [Dyadobacter sp. NIV53]
MANRHVIGKHEISIEIGDVGLAFETQNEVSDLCRTTLYPALDKLFDRYAPENEHWKIDSLVLDLGDLAVENWQKTFVQKTIEQMEEQLRKKLNKRTFEMAYNKHAKQEETINKEATITSIDVPVETTFLKFLQTGSFAWNSPVRTISELENQLKITGKLSNQIVQLVQQDYTVLTRLVWQFSSEFIKAVLANLVSKKPEVLSSFNTLFVQKTWKGAFLEIGVSEQKRTQLENHFRLALLLEAFPVSTGKDVLIKSMRALLSEKQQNIWIEYIQKTIQIDENETILAEVSKVLVLKTSPDNVKQKVKQIQVDDDSEAIYINQAGLVLLHPFLPVFFKKTNLLDNNQWKSNVKQRRAVLLCNYLVSGQSTAEETDLSLHKIMCGLPFTTPIENEFELTEIEKTASENLLNAVLEYWTALKSTRTDELRGSFLVRNGKLSHKDNQWFLKVEQRPYDMLLDHLPWTISMIQNTFMPEMLRVEW